MLKRTLEDIERELLLCEEYNRIGTVQAAFRYCNDLRALALDVVSQLKALRLETQPTTIPTLPGNTNVWTLLERVERLEEKVERIDRDL